MMDSTMEHNQNATPAQETSDAENTQGAPTELMSMVSLLAKSVQGMQGSMGNAYQSMANQLKQSMEMSQAMSDMSDLLLANSVVICSRIERDGETQKPVLILTTENTGKLPIPGIAGVLRIGSDDNPERKFNRSTASSATLLSSTVVATKGGSKSQSKELQHSIYQQTTTPSIPEAKARDQPSLGDVLLPGSIRVETFQLDLERMDEWIIKLEANFSGMTGKKLFKRHECCIYLLDQCSIDWLPEATSIEGVQSGWTVNMMTTQVRQVLRVPATEGVRIGMGFIMKAFQGDFTMKGAVGNLSEDKQATQLVLWPEKSGAEDALKLVRIRSELGLLGDHPQPESESMIPQDP